MIKELLYFIYDDKGQTYDNDGNGNLITNSTQKPLGNTPDGWQETAIQYGRNDNYYGIVRSFTVPLGFVKLAARIVRQLYYGVKGIQAVANLMIVKFNHQQMKMTHLYHSAINFSTISDKDEQVEISTTDGELSAMIAANEGTTYEVAVDVPDAINVTMDAITMYSAVSATVYANPETAFFQSHVFLGVTTYNSETKYLSLLWNDFNQYYSSDSFNTIADTWQFASSDDSVSLRVQSSSFKVLIAGASSYRLSIYLSESAQELILIPDTPIPGTPNYLDLNFDVNVTVPPNDYGHLVLVCGGTGAGLSIAVIDDNDMTYTYDFRYKSTVNQWLRPMYVFQKLIEKISSGKYTATSDYLTNEAENFVVGCGDSLRGFHAGDTEGYVGPVIKTSLRDFFQSFNTIAPIGISIENNVAILERRERFYDSTKTIVDLGDVSKCTGTSANDYIPSSIQIGWPVQTYDDINGREEFNTLHTYTTPITRQSKVLDLSSVYRADCYGMEITRINLDSKTTTDSDSDSEVFILNISPDGNGGYIINRPAGSIITGVKGGNTTYNWLLSPKRCLLRHGAWIHGGMWLQDDGYITFSSSEKNQLMTSTIDGVTIIENSNVLVSSLPKGMFIPHLFEIICKTPYNIVDLIEDSPFGVIQFSYKGNSYKGFVLQAGQQPALNPEQTFKLLASPTNNMLNLIM